MGSVLQGVLYLKEVAAEIATSKHKSQLAANPSRGHHNLMALIIQLY